MTTKRGVLMLALGCVFCLLLSLPLSAQEADISGTVRDASGAVIPAASVKLTSQATGTGLVTQTNGRGVYFFPHVPAGVYNLSASARGFQSEDRMGIIVNVTEHTQINFGLKVGAVSQTVTVTGAAQSVDTADAVNGQTINRTFINDLPLLGRSVLDLAFLAPGVTQPPGFVFGMTSSVPYLTGNNFSSDGSRNASSDIQIDGITTGETVSGGLFDFASYTPSVDAVQEFKVQQTNFSAEYGFTGATITNVITRSGTNEFHGSAFEFVRNSALDANNFFNNRAGLSLPLRQNIFGGTVGGPIRKNKTFFFVDYEGTRTHSLGTANAGVPSAAEKQGDFSELCGDNMTPQNTPGTFNAAGQCSAPGGQLWDPYTGVYDPNIGGPLRSQFIPFNNMATYTSPGNPALNGTSSQLAPFAGNLIDPVAQKLIQYYPAPNLAVGTPSYNRFNNWAGSGINLLNNDQGDVKIDQHFNERNTLSAKYAERNTFQHLLNCFGNMADPCTQGPADSTAHLFSLDFTHIFGPATVFTFSYGLTRTSRFIHTIKGDYPSLDPVKTLGLPSYIATSGVPQLPNIIVGSYAFASPADPTSIGTAAWSYLRDGQDTHDLLAALSHLQGRHELKFGGEFRMHRFNNGQPGVPGGLFEFDYIGTSQESWAGGGGDAMASFLAGTGGGDWGRYEVPAFLATQNFNWAGYAQDNFKATKKLTVNVGVRYDLTLPATERHNELNWTDPNVASPLQVPGLGPLKGGDVFANSQLRTNFDTDYRDIQPRFGLAYSLNDKTVVRAGYGIYYDPSVAEASADVVDSQGFAQNTNWLSSYQGAGVLPYGRLSNPFPSGVELPPGRSLGLLTNVGETAEGSERSLNFTPYEQSWSFGIQRTLPWNVLIDATYIGKKGTHLYFGAGGFINIDHLGSQEEQMSAAQIAALVAPGTVKNPFYGIITDPNSPLSAPMISQYEKDLPYPQFDSNGEGSFLIESPPWANSIYNAFQLRVEKRFTNGLQFLFTYVNSKSIDDASLPNNGNSFLGGASATILDPNNLELERSLSQFDIPQVAQFSYVYQLPFGRGKRFAGNLNPVLNTILGGWQTNGIWRFDNGQPLLLGLNGGLALPGYGQRPELSAPLQRNNGSEAAQITQYFANPGVATVPAMYTLGDASRTVSVRSPGTEEATLSLFKEFPLSRVREGTRLEFRLESFNAFNHPQFCGPNTAVNGGIFGLTTCQANLPRQVQMALKLYF